MPKTLPFMFKDWKEYRDYLLVHLIRPEFWEHYRNEWKGQDDTEWYETHVREIILNDTCGTLNKNKAASKTIVKKNKDGRFTRRSLRQFVESKGVGSGN